MRGRLEWVGPVCFDVGHTPAAAQAAAAGFVAAAGRGTLVVGVSEVKRVEDVARALLPAAERVVVTRPEHGASVERLAAAIGACERIPDPASALERARTYERPVLVAGSLSLVHALLPGCSR